MVLCTSRFNQIHCSNKQYLPISKLLSTQILRYATDLVLRGMLLYLYLPDTPNTSRRVLRGGRAKMTLKFSQNNQNITCEDVLIA